MAEAAVAIVTGAGSGIGRALCELLDEAGFCVTLVGRDESKLIETVELLAQQPKQSPGTLIIPADVSDRAQAESVVDLTHERWGRIDVLINNAAVLVVQPIDQIDEPTLFRTFAANCFGPAYLIARCWPVFRRQGSGRIVNVSSMSAVDPFPGVAAYGASKAALESLARSAMTEGRAHGILAFNIVLGAVETSMLRQIASERQLPTSRTLTALQAARAVADCALGRRDAQAGQSLNVAVPG